MTNKIKDAALRTVIIIGICIYADIMLRLLINQ